MRKSSICHYRNISFILQLYRLLDRQFGSMFSYPLQPYVYISERLVSAVFHHN